MSHIGRIKLGAKTLNHATTLKGLGYTVEQVDDHIHITCSQFIQEADLTSTEETKALLKRMVQEKSLFTYTTRAIVKGPEGEEKLIFGFPFCNWLERQSKGLSAMVAKPAKGGKKASKSAFSLADLLG